MKMSDIEEIRPRHVVESWYKYQNTQRTVRTLFESVLNPEVLQALKSWKRACSSPGVLIGGLAMSYNAIPRTTVDVDVLYLSSELIPDTVPGFKRNRNHSFLHLDTHVEIEVLDPAFLKIDVRLADTVIRNAHAVDGMLVADSGGIIALKLQRGNRRDLGDVETLIRAGNVNIESYINLLTTDQIDLYNQIQQEVQNEVPLGD